MGSTAGPRRTTAEVTARECLARGVTTRQTDGIERRHETLMSWAEAELGLDRAYAEQVYALAEEERLEPAFALQLVGCGIGVRELESPEPDMEEFAAAQQAPPDWVGEETVELEDVALERRLRATFRRLRAQLESTSSVEAAVEAFLDEPDVGLVELVRATDSPATDELLRRMTEADDGGG